MKDVWSNCGKSALHLASTCDIWGVDTLHKKLHLLDGKTTIWCMHMYFWGWMFSLCIGIYARSNDLSPFLLFIVGHLDLISVVQSILHVLSSTGMQLSVFPSQSFMHV